MFLIQRDIAQFGSAPALGAGCIPIKIITLKYYNTSLQSD